jgi:hypothetical protein
MKCLLLLHTDEASWLAMSDDDKRRTAATFGAWTEEIRGAGAFVEAYRPQPSSTAKRVRVGAGGAETQDGVLGDPKEPLTGLYVINVPDMAAAVSWAERNPAARMGAIEVRPIGDRGPAVG